MLCNNDGIFPPPFSDTAMCRAAGPGAYPDMSFHIKAKGSRVRNVYLPFKSTCSEKTLRHLLLAIHLHPLGCASIPQTCCHATQTLLQCSNIKDGVICYEHAKIQSSEGKFKEDSVMGRACPGN